MRISNGIMMGGLAAAAMLVACGPTQTSAPPVAVYQATLAPTPSGSPVPSVRPSSSPSPTLRPTASPTPTPTPTASGLAHSSIYVAQFGDNNVTVYAPNPMGTINELPVLQINGSSTGLSGPVGVAVDASGRIYVTNKFGGAGSGSITVYAANLTGIVNAAPIATIAGANTGLNAPIAIALDSAGKIYVANYAGTITAYAANPSGTLNETPFATIAGPDTQIASPYGIAIDGAGTIYVANELGGQSSGDTGSITSYAANPSGTLDEVPVAEIIGNATTLYQPIGIAVDASGVIYVANQGGPAGSGILVYPAHPSGIQNEAPIATIFGTATQLGNAAGIALDTSGNIYVSNQYGMTNNGGGVTVFAANPSGTLNEAPIGTITGNNSRLYDPSGIAVH